jgi:hypothetical protein
VADAERHLLREVDSLAKEDLKHEKETDPKRHRPVVAKGCHAHEPAGLSPDLYLLSLSVGTGRFFHAADQRPLLSHPHFRRDYSIEAPCFQNACVFVGSSYLHLPVGEASVSTADIYLFVGDYLAIFSLVLLVFLILSQALREGETTTHRIMGGVAAYLLLGLTWFLAYHLVALGFPEAFSAQGSPSSPDTNSLPSQLFYFSFVTLTSIGYGDIVPVHPVARMLVILEGVTGQLFPAVLIARLVSMEIGSRGAS